MLTRSPCMHGLLAQASGAASESENAGLAGLTLHLSTIYSYCTGKLARIHRTGRLGTMAYTYVVIDDMMPM